MDTIMVIDAIERGMTYLNRPLMDPARCRFAAKSKEPLRFDALASEGVIGTTATSLITSNRFPDIGNSW